MSTQPYERPSSLPPLNEIDSRSSEEASNVQRQRIRSARRALGLTQKELAEAIGVSSVSIRAWERGDWLPSSAHADALERELLIEVLTRSEASRKVTRLAATSVSIRLDAEEAAMLDRIKGRLGLSSRAGTVRRLIAEAGADAEAVA